MAIFDEAMKCIAPVSAKQFLGSVQPKPIMSMVMYIAILGILGLVGTIVGMAVIGTSVGFGITIKMPIMWAVISGVIGWIGTIVAIVGGGMAIAMLSQGMVGRQITNEEAVTLAGYAATPVLLAGILNIIPIIGGILVFVAWLYAAYLFFLGAGVRFGADKALVTTILYIVAAIVITLIFGLIAGALTAAAIMSSVNPYAGYAAGYGSYAGY